MTCYLRFEGINLSHFIYDTNDLNTTRGGGLLMLNALEQVSEVLKQTLPNMFCITKGASWGLYQLPCNLAQAAQLRDKLHDNLCKKDPAYQHATFAIDVWDDAGTQDYSEIKNTLQALNRWRQMQSPALAIPKPQTELICSIDKVRPAIKQHGTDPLSASVQARRDYGNEQKQSGFYHQRGGEGLKFTRDIGELANNQGHALHHKIAVIYIDGNNFGSLAAKCSSPEEQKAFDSSLRQGQDAIMCALLNQARNNPSWQTAKGKIRIETLIWGGDEIMWIVPAWQAWETLTLFYQQAANIKIDEKLMQHYGTDDQCLRFAAGVVFCHHNAPIHRIKTLAHDLAEIAKEKNRKENHLAYEVLESFDHAGLDSEQTRERRYAKLGNKIAFDGILASQDLTLLASVVGALKAQQAPRSKIYQIVNALLAYEPDAKYSRLTKKLYQDYQHTEKTIKPLIERYGEHSSWLYLRDLWDYLATEQKANDDD